MNQRAEFGEFGHGDAGDLVQQPEVGLVRPEEAYEPVRVPEHD